MKNIFRNTKPFYEKCFSYYKILLLKMFSIIKNLLWKIFFIIQKSLRENIFHNTKISYEKYFLQDILQPPNLFKKIFSEIF